MMGVGEQFYYLSIWERVKRYFNDRPIGYVVTRKMLIDGVSGNGSTTTIDTYRNYLLQAGYISVSRRGRYRVLKRIPKLLTVKEVVHQAYKEEKFDDFLTESDVMI